MAKKPKTTKLVRKVKLPKTMRAFCRTYLTRKTTLRLRERYKTLDDLCAATPSEVLRYMERSSDLLRAIEEALTRIGRGLSPDTDTRKPRAKEPLKRLRWRPAKPTRLRYRQPVMLCPPKVATGAYRNGEHQRASLGPRYFDGRPITVYLRDMFAGKDHWHVLGQARGHWFLIETFKGSDKKCQLQAYKSKVRFLEEYPDAVFMVMDVSGTSSIAGDKKAFINAYRSR